MGIQAQAKQVDWSDPRALSKEVTQGNIALQIFNFSHPIFRLAYSPLDGSGSSFDNGTGIFVNQAEIVAPDIPGRSARGDEQVRIQIASNCFDFAANVQKAYFLIGFARDRFRS